MDAVSVTIVHSCRFYSECKCHSGANDPLKQATTTGITLASFINTDAEQRSISSTLSHTTGIDPVWCNRTHPPPLIDTQSIHSRIHKNWQQQCIINDELRLLNGHVLNFRKNAKLRPATADIGKEHFNLKWDIMRAFSRLTADIRQCMIFLLQQTFNCRRYCDYKACYVLRHAVQLYALPVLQLYISLPFKTKKPKQNPNADNSRVAVELMRTEV